MSAADRVSFPQNPDYETMEASVTSIRGIFRLYPKLRGIRQGIEPLIRRNNAKSEGPVNLLLGPTRSGKSHLLGDLVRDYPVQPKAIVHDNGNFADRIPLLVVRVRRGTSKALGELIYEKLVGQKPATVLGSRFRLDDVVGEIRRIGSECQLRLLVLDEAHQSVDVADVASLIKDLSNLAVFAILVVGTEKARRLINADDELQSRTTRIFQIKPFAWSDEDFGTWIKILGDIDRRLSEQVFGVLSGLAERDMAYALMVAAQGVIGHMATLVEFAAKDVVAAMASGLRARQGLEARLLWHDLEAMFDGWAPGQDRINPFSETNRPHADGVPKLGSLPAFESFEVGGEEEPASGVKGRTRRNARDTVFRK